MTDLMQLKAGDRVLEIGTGSGYQAAVLAEMAGGLQHRDHRSAGQTGEASGCRSSATARCKPEQRRLLRLAGKTAPFEHHGDAAPAMCTAADQAAKPGGRMVIPARHAVHDPSLMLVRRKRRSVTTAPYPAVRFVR